MILINEYRVSQDKKYLIIDVLILELSYYEDVTLTLIVLNNQNALNSGTTSLITESSKSGDWVYVITECNGNKHYRTYLDLESAGLPYEKISDTLFFMEVNCTGNYAANTPCGMLSPKILGVAYDDYPIYLQGINLLREMNGCEPPGNLMDYIFTTKAFELSLLTAKYDKAIDYWNIITNRQEKTVSKKCGCHG